MAKGGFPGVKKVFLFGFECLLFISLFLATGCSSTPRFNSLPETNEALASFAGSWVSNNAIVSRTWGSSISVPGRQFYIFYEDGTGDIIDYNGDVITNRRVFHYRLSDTMIGFQFLKGGIYSGGGDFTRPYRFSPDGNQIIFPQAKYNLISYFSPFSIAKETPPPPPVPRPPRSIENPTITPEELELIELAYAETVRDIENRGRRLRIDNRQERAAFIQRWQGNPDTPEADAAREEILVYYRSSDTPETRIVAMARREPNDFRKVRMIHDWVADVFSYDYDLLWWMQNVSGKNAIFTLGELVKRERGVCFEYAILFWFLMDASGIETYLVSEIINPTSAHAYNMVVINGTGYIIDTTWDSGNKYERGKITQFFMTQRKDWFMPNVSQSYTLRPAEWR
jgi:transglutaminase-like putative cysteine protease